jgi:Mg-dependent DNase
LPLIIHARNCDVVMEQILQEQQKIGRFSFVLHCYTSGLELAKTGLSLGGYVSFSGIVSFKAAEAVRTVCLETPLDRLLIETDCPYLAPVPLRGRRNEPAFVAHVAAFIAQLRGLSVEALTAQTDENFSACLRAPSESRPLRRPRADEAAPDPLFGCRRLARNANRDGKLGRLRSA